jgi:hypothetical protein
MRARRKARRTLSMARSSSALKPLERRTATRANPPLRSIVISSTTIDFSTSGMGPSKISRLERATRSASAFLYPSTVIGAMSGADAAGDPEGGAAAKRCSGARTGGGAEQAASIAAPEKPATRSLRFMEIGVPESKLVPQPRCR